MNVGLIGLGIMGKPMGKNLLKKGYKLTVYDIRRAAVEEMVAAGATPAENAGEAAAQCDVLLTMLPNSPQVEQVMPGMNGAGARMRRGSAYIDMSSINPLASRKIARELERYSVQMLDAPVSGGEPKAADGTLAFMVGGPEDLFLQCRELLLAMGSSVVHCGAIGAGNVTKLCNQVIVAVNIAAVAEALTLGQKAGVAPDAIYHAIRGGLAGSTVLDAKAPMMMDRNFRPGFKIDLHVKDLKNVLEAGGAAGATMPLTNQVIEMMETLQHEGEGGSDHSALIKFYEKFTDETLHR